MINNMAFGQYVRSKCINRNFPLRQFAELIGISPVYLCDIEKGRKPAHKKEVVLDIIIKLNLNK